MGLPQPPPGFKLDTPTAASPPPPPGFKLDQAGIATPKTQTPSTSPAAPSMFSLQAVENTLFPSWQAGSPAPEPTGSLAHRLHADEPIMQAIQEPDVQRAMGVALSFAPGNLESATAVPTAIGAPGARPAAVAANKAGYVLPPSEIHEEPGIVPSAASAWSGKIKTQQAASQRNQDVTNELAATDLGLPKGTTLSDQVFDQVRSAAGRAYQDVASAVPRITIDPQFDQQIAALAGANSTAARMYPGILKTKEIDNLINSLRGQSQFPTDVGLEVVKKLRHDSNINFRSRDDPGRASLALAQRHAADAIDDLMEREIYRNTLGKTDVIAKYRAARRLIAKSYDVQAATNPATGDVRARRLAALATRRPFTGNLDLIAKTATAFPKSMMEPSSFGHAEDWSALDFFAGVGATMAGHPEAAALIVGRHPARAAILSKPVQNRLAQPPRPPHSMPWAVPAAAGIMFPPQGSPGS
jgi:hypothetical protein